MKSRIQKGKFLFFILIFWIFIYPCTSSNNSTVHHLQDTLKIEFEKYLGGVHDTVVVDLFTGQIHDYIVELVNFPSGNNSYDVFIDYTDAENYVLRFDGIDDMVEYGPGILHNFNSWTIKAWIYIHKEKYSQSIYSEWSEAYTLGSDAADMSILNGKLALNFDCYGSSTEDITGGPDFQVDNWYHIATVKDKNDILLYVDGLLYKTATTYFEIDSGLIANSGAYYSEEQSNFAGNIFDLCIWDYALTENELKTSMYTDIRGDEKGLVSYWKFNMGSGNIVYDRSKNKRDGLLRNSPQWIKTTAPFSLKWLNINKEKIFDQNSLKYLELNLNASGLNSGIYIANIELIEEHSNDTAIKIPLAINVRSAPDIYLSTDSLIFDEVTYGVTKSLKFRIINNGFDTLAISNITTNNSQYTLDRKRFNIPPGATEIIHVNYDPVLIGKQHAILSIFNNDPDQKETALRLNANRIIIPRITLIRWLAITSIILIVLIMILIFYRINLKQRINKTLEKQVHEAVKEIEQQQNIIIHQSSLTILGEMSSGTSDEIKTIVQNILATSQNIKNEIVGSKVKDIYSGVDKINKLIEHIRIFSSQQKSKLTEKYSVNEVISDALSMVQVKIKNLKIEVILELEDRLPALTGNPYKVEQVVLNLLNNAIDAIRINISRQNFNNQNKIKIATSLVDGFEKIEVTDTGVGINEIDKPLIFKPFYTTKEISKAAGLGLSISQSIIHEMKGTIEIFSHKEMGTTCIVNLPVHA